jgi:hypothetical protein
MDILHQIFFDVGSVRKRRMARSILETILTSAPNGMGRCLVFETLNEMGWEKFLVLWNFLLFFLIKKFKFCSVEI